MADLQEDLVLDNRENIQQTNENVLPESGPYKILVRDMTFDEKKLIEFLTGVGIQYTRVDTRVYQDPKGKTVYYTFYIMIEERDDAVAILRLNEEMWEGCKFVARYLRPQTHDGRRDKYKDRDNQYTQARTAFNRNDFGTDIKEAEESRHKPVDLRRENFGSEIKNVEAPQKLSRETFGTQMNESEAGRPTKITREIMGQDSRPALGKGSFSRDNFGSDTRGFGISRDIRGQDLKQAPERGGQRAVTLNFGRKSE